MNRNVTRLSPHEDVDSWVRDLEGTLKRDVSPAKELCNEASKFSDWRLSYGVQVYEPTGVYFLSFYPPFCTTPKATYHYTHISELARDVLTLENFALGIDLEDNGAYVEFDAHDIIACAFAILRDKESFELFQEQKYLMDLGLKHFHLDNYYQDCIKRLCLDYYDAGRVLGRSFSLTLFDKISKIGATNV